MGDTWRLVVEDSFLRGTYVSDYEEFVDLTDRVSNYDVLFNFYERNFDKIWDVDYLNLYNDLVYLESDRISEIILMGSQLSKEKRIRFIDNLDKKYLYEFWSYEKLSSLEEAFVAYGFIDVIKDLLIVKKSNIKQLFLTMLIVAIHYKQKEIVILLLDNNPGMNLGTIVELCITNNDTEMFDVLYSKITKSDQLVTCLRFSVEKNNLYFAEKLLKIKKFELRYVMATACEKNYKEMIDLLLDYGASINFNGYNHTLVNPLDVAINAANLDLVKFLVDRGANLDNIHPTTIDCLVGNNSEDILEFLIDNGAVNFDKDLCLINLSYSGNNYLIQKLLDMGANINSHHDAPLEVAIRENHPSTVKLLLDNGANPKNINPQSLKNATENAQIDIINILSDYM